MRQRRWVELLNDYDCEIRYHPGKANVVADALSLKERSMLHSVCIHNDIQARILQAQHTSVTEGNMYQEMACGVELLLETKANSLLYYLDRIWVPDRDDLRIFLMNESHKTRYSVHPGADKMYMGLRQQYWWPDMKKDIALFGLNLPKPNSQFRLSPTFVRRSEAFSGDTSTGLFPAPRQLLKAALASSLPREQKTRTKGPDQLVSPTYGSSDPVGGREPTPEFKPDSQPPRVFDSLLASSRPDECRDVPNCTFCHRKRARL
ncbi:hypothetical protein L1987_15267 [Smallanthus sonchifolius]|uniref:Uncharacterized protein n=1 Tax=Smallanthus sonchifolius TaxID=185202 RepID=A0ACB9J6M6_9ASTR|nr:hypothetical protein L1987_15267 [Smallanthus sonchifolius]